MVISLALVALMGITRLAVFPASIWEQDEAYFAAAVVEIDVADSQPHPPFFPLWIGLGRVVHWAGIPPAQSLMLVSAVSSSLLLIPLAALWSRFLGRGLALAAAVMALTVPGVWLYSPRAFSEIGATALLVPALVFWTRPGWRSTAAGSSAAGLAILIRPQFVLVVVVAMAVLLVQRRGRTWAAVVMPAAILVAVGTTWFVIAAGGLAEILYVSSLHATQHFGALSEADRGLFESGFARVLVSPVVATMWLILTVLGAFSALARKGKSQSGWLVAAALFAMIIVVFGFSNPAHPRYAAPLVVLSSGFVVVGLRRLLGERGAAIGVGGLACWAAAVVLPSASVYRDLPSPPLRALDRAVQLAVEGEGVLVVDRGLHAFVGYREAVGTLGVAVVYDHMLELGAAPPPDAAVVMVFDGIDGGPAASREAAEVFSCDQALLRRLSQDRFLDVTVTGVRSTAPQGVEDIVASIREGSSGRREGETVDTEHGREDDEGEDGFFVNSRV